MVTVCPSQFATRRTLFHVLVGCGLLMLKVSRLKLPVIWLLVSMWLNTDRKSGSAGMPRPISYAVFCLKKKKRLNATVSTVKHALKIRGSPGRMLANKFIRVDRCTHDIHTATSTER